MLGFVIDEDLCIVDCLGQGPVLVAKLCEVQAGRGQDKPRIPNGVVRVPRIQGGAGRGARLRARQEPHHPRPLGGGGSQRQPIVDVVPPQGKVRCQDSNALRFASTVHSPRDQLGFAGKEGQEDPSGHGEEVKIRTVVFETQPPD